MAFNPESSLRVIASGCKWFSVRLFWLSIIVFLLIQPVSAMADGANGSGTGITGNWSNDAVLLAAYVLLALGVSFLCSVAEAVLLSITPSYIESQKENHPKHAALLKRLKQDDIDRSLAAILTLNTIAHTVGAIGAGAKATIVFGSAWFGVFSAVMTLLILVLSEIVPKTIGAAFWKNLAGPVSIFIRAMITFLFPIVWMSERITKLISPEKDLNIFTRDEFAAMASAGVESGEIASNESRIIQNLLRFDSIKVSDIMTPRTVISAFQEDMTISESSEQVTQTSFSRLPVYGENMDDITGFVLKADILIMVAQNKGSDKLKTVKRDILPVPETIPLTVLLENFLKAHNHIAIVVSEHGGTEGLVTLEDLFETVMGMEIMDETDNVKDMRALARKQWMARAKNMGLELDKFEEESN